MNIVLLLGGANLRLEVNFSITWLSFIGRDQFFLIPPSLLLLVEFSLSRFSLNLSLYFFHFRFFCPFVLSTRKLFHKWSIYTSANGKIDRLATMRASCANSSYLGRIGFDWNDSKFVKIYKSIVCRSKLK